MSISYILPELLIYPHRRTQRLISYFTDFNDFFIDILYTGPKRPLVSIDKTLQLL